ncbi:MAG: hypothetical protein NDJ89_02280 [Oligoflexia bacterium]|nr:hypothetical protein [Oligoflexia bacterium]
MLDPISKFIMENVIDKTADILMPAMILTFFVGVIFRALIFYTAKAELKFCTEFEKRVRKFFWNPESQRLSSFFLMTKQLLEKTYYESFELRAKFKRRNLDSLTSVTDRVFLIQDGAAFTVRDTLRQIRYLKRDGFPPRMLDISKSSFDNNPVFNKVIGIFPVGPLNELINILPSLFIIGGIFGTFLGISKGLPDLGGMDLSNIEDSKRVMDLFLVKISQAMIKSIVGIALSVAMSLVNTLLSAEGVYYNLVNRFSTSLEILWNETSTNELGETQPAPAAAHEGPEPVAEPVGADKRVA